jgi:hypothetical protein
MFRIVSEMAFRFALGVGALFELAGEALRGLVPSSLTMRLLPFLSSCTVVADEPVEKLVGDRQKLRLQRRVNELSYQSTTDIPARF